MHDKLKNFLDTLPPEQMAKFAAALEEVETDMAYVQIARETEQSVETIKAAELLQTLTMEGFFDGLADLQDVDIKEIN
jgi:hypothetical protein